MKRISMIVAIVLSLLACNIAYADSKVEGSSLNNTKMITGAGAELVEVKDGKRDYPASTVVFIATTADDEDGAESLYVSTGVLIGPDTVMTCAHSFYGVIKNVGKVSGNVVDPNIRNIHNIKVFTDFNLKNKKSSEAHIVEDSLEYGRVASDIYEELTSDNCSPDLMREDFRTNKLKSYDYAILRLDEPLGNKVGWMDLRVLDTSHGQEWGTVYQFPNHIPRFPDLDELEKALRADAKENNYDTESNSNLGKCIDVFDILESGEDSIKDAYKDLFKLNDEYDMYSSYYQIKYGSDSPGQLLYKISTDSGASGSPVISSKYNYATRKYDDYVCGIHSGYLSFGSDIPLNSYGDTALYIKNSLGFPVDFNYEHNESEKRLWNIAYDMYGYNRATAISSELLTYLKESELFPGYGYNPYK